MDAPSSRSGPLLTAGALQAEIRTCRALRGVPMLNADAEMVATAEELGLAALVGAAAAGVSGPHTAAEEVMRMGAGADVAMRVGALARSRARSSRAPMACPATADAMLNSTAYLGMITALRSMAMKGMLACTATNQDPLNFSQCSRHLRVEG